MTLLLSKMYIMKSKLRGIMKSVQHKDKVKFLDCHWISVSRAPLVILNTSNEINDVINTGHQQRVN